MPSLESDYPRYLRSKRSVDDRAVNERVLRRLATELDGRDELRVLTLGAGIGGAIERLVERDVFPVDAEVSCTAVDVRESNVRAARERLPEWARSRGYTVTDLDAAGCADRGGDGIGSRGGEAVETPSGSASSRLRIETGSRTIDVDLVVADAFSIVDDGEWDLLVGQAFLDLFDLADALPRLLSALPPGGLCYFPITFDGGTVFEPAVDPIDPNELERAFHAHIDRSGGDSRAGRHLLTRLPAEGVEVLAAGGSDWVVHARDGAYPAEEGTFLRFIVDTVADALADDGDDGDDRDGRSSESVPLAEALDAWRERRCEQIESGDLVYVAHQLDVLGRVRADG